MTGDDRIPAAQAARRLVRMASIGGLATLRGDGGPFSSMVAVATTAVGEPTLLLSTLAAHTRNLQKDSRASLLISAENRQNGDPLAGSRVTLNGDVVADDDPATRRRFLARHPTAAGYADFGDFGFYRLVFTDAHLVAGFGRIVDLEREKLLASAGLADSEGGAVAHMNADHADAVRLYATRLLGLRDGQWMVTGVDPDGLDMACDGQRARLDFAETVETPGALRATLADLAGKARNNG